MAWRAWYLMACISWSEGNFDLRSPPCVQPYFVSLLSSVLLFFCKKMCTSFSDLCVYICAFWSALQVLCHGMATKHCTSIKRWTEHQCPCIKNSLLEGGFFCFVLCVKPYASCAAVLICCTFHLNSMHFLYAHAHIQMHTHFINALHFKSYSAYLKSHAHPCIPYSPPKCLILLFCCFFSPCLYHTHHDLFFFQ